MEKELNKEIHSGYEKEINLKTAKIQCKTTEDGIDIWEVLVSTEHSSALCEIQGNTKTRNKDKKNKDILIDSFLEGIIINQGDVVFNFNLDAWRPEDANDTIKARKHQNTHNDNFYQVTGLTERSGKGYCNLTKFCGTKMSQEIKSFKQTREDHADALMNWIRNNGSTLNS